jgi:ADP-heptose:LPS heptosyltransferase
MGPEESAAAKQALHEIAGRRVELEASERPLPAVLRHVDAVLTVSSSVVTDAAVMGVPSVLVDTDAKAQFPSEIASGWTVAASDRVADALDEQIERAAHLTPYATGSVGTSAALDRVLPR